MTAGKISRTSGDRESCSRQNDVSVETSILQMNVEHPVCHPSPHTVTGMALNPGPRKFPRPRNFEEGDDSCLCTVLGCQSAQNLVQVGGGNEVQVVDCKLYKGRHGRAQ